MIAFVKLDRDDTSKELKTYQCSRCGSVLATSHELLRFNGADTHSFVNPSGIQCNFITFSHCENVLVHHDLYSDNSWFAGYGWRFLFCGTCSQHIGWKYDALRTKMNPDGFFGVLVDALQVSPISE